ncbi:hypothetical protein [Rhodoblastus sp.]|uniref:hypothetical protein n=1 Tax=Rhodoblastus sp. TaxID=1962975 RepID=UPI003F96ABEC
MKMKSLARRDSANQALKIIDVASIASEPTASSRAAQQISRKFGLTPTLAALVVTLAGLGPREVRQ